MKTPRIACVIGTAIVASALHAQPMSDDFESHEVGLFPSSTWNDITDRTVGSPTVSPTMTIIETTDAHGNPTRAAQTNQEPGTNGLYQYVSPDTQHHHISMDVRIDSMHAANAGWPVSVGYSRYLGQDDVNANPQALVYVWTGRVWNLFIALGDGRPAVDLRVTGPQFNIGQWYTVTLDVDVATGFFEAQVFDAATGDRLNRVTHTYAQWDPEVDSFTSITSFDGGNVNSALQGQSTIDNVMYAQSPLGLCPADLSDDGELDFIDVSLFAAAMSAGSPAADLNNDGETDFIDISEFVASFFAGCP